MIKISCSTAMLTGDTYLEKLQCAKKYGYDAVELRMVAEETTKENIADVINAVKETDVEISSLLYTGKSLIKVLNSEEALKEKQAHTEASLELAVRLGCKTIINPECYSQNPLPRFNDPKYPTAQEKDWLCRYVRHADDYARHVGGLSMMEPLNRYETHFYYTLGECAKIMAELNTTNTGLIADFFHLNIEEADLFGAFRKYGDKIVHVHLGDSNRMLPGQGHIDFAEGIRTLIEVGYDAYMGLECGILGDDRPAELIACAARLKKWINDARSI